MGTDTRSRRDSESRDTFIVMWPPLPPFSGRDYTCCCGLYMHPNHPMRNPDAIHIRGCPVRPRPDTYERQAIIAALRHCQGMGHPLPLTEAEIDALCKRLGDTK